MKNILLLTIIGLLITMPVFAYEKHYIKNNKGQTTGYTKRILMVKLFNTTKKYKLNILTKKILPVRLQSILKLAEN